MTPQITVLDAGGQYCHLIARKIRDLGVYAEVRPSETPAAELAGRKGIVISGGPSSVYDPASPHIDAAILEPGHGAAILGICYGQQVIAHEMGGLVRQGERGEYGIAHLSDMHAHAIFDGFDVSSQVWMNHRDQVQTVPAGFDVLAATETCGIAAMAHRDRPIVAVQFHPEVAHTPFGSRLLSNFVFEICRCERDWDPRNRIGAIEDQIRRIAGDRNIFFFVSGGVDSTVAYTLCLRALGPERVYGVYVDTGLMREGETAYVERLFKQLGATAFHIEHAARDFLDPLQTICDPERKRHIIGGQFVAVQDRVLNTGHFLDGHWILGQGTIYPDTIESGGAAKADLIKTHHNRVAGIQKLIDEGRIVEPLTSFYKDEVREIGAELGIPAEFLHRHPFPGPALAIRCLCSDVELPIERRDEGWFLPIRTVGVQGDARSYRAVLALDDFPPGEEAAALVNASPDVNRVVAIAASNTPIADTRVTRGFLTPDRLGRLRRCDSIVRRMTAETGFDNRVWQLPVVLIPLGTPEAPDSVVLRPIDSVDGMTAQVVRFPPDLLGAVSRELLNVPGITAVLVNLTHKPPGTIEWE